MFTRIRNKTRNIFIAGLLVFIPTSVTVYVFYLVFSKFNNVLTAPRLSKLVNLFGGQLPPYLNIPFLSIITIIILIFLLGLITTSYGGKRAVQSVESALDKIPLFRTIYQGSKSIMEALASPEKNAFRQVVLVEFPTKGTYAVGFITGDSPKGIHQTVDEEESMVNVFIPTVPNPTTGFLLMFPRKKLHPLNITAEEGFRLVLSAGTISPKDIHVISPVTERS